MVTISLFQGFFFFFLLHFGGILGQDDQTRSFKLFSVIQQIGYAVIIVIFSKDICQLRNKICRNYKNYKHLIYH